MSSIAGRLRFVDESGRSQLLRDTLATSWLTGDGDEPLGTLLLPLS